MPRIPLIGPSNTSFSLAAAAQQSLNCFLETIENGGDKNKYVLRGRPGIRLFKDLTVIDAAAHPVRGFLSGAGRLFVCAGTKFFEVDITGALVGSTSTLANDGLPVDILPNGTQLFVVSAGLSYTNNGLGLVQNTLPALSGQVTTLAKLVVLEATPNSSTGHTDSFDIGMLGQTMTINGVNYTVADLVNPQMLHLTTSAGVQSFHDWSCTPVLNASRGAFADGFFVISRPSSRQWNKSALYDGTTWPPLDFAYKEGYPDNIRAPWSEPPLLYLLGAETSEAWRNTGAALFPFERVDGGFSRTGLASIWSPVSILGRLHMLSGGSYGQVVAVRMEGVTPIRISTHAVEEALNSISFPGQGFAFAYLDRGHWFWVITFDGGNAWVYDATESALQGSPQWHERAQFSGGVFSPYLPRFHTFIPEWNSGMHIVGDYASGKLYEMHSDYFDDNTTDIKCVRALAYVYSENKRIYHRRIEFELETGTAGTPPVVKLDWSDDRGQTWRSTGGAGTTVTLGPGVTGVYTTRYFLEGLGSSRGRVYRISIQGQGRVCLIDAVLEAEIGDI